MTNTLETRSRITDSSKRTEEVLILLLTDIEDLKSRLQNEIDQRDKETKELREKLNDVTSDLNGQLKAEIDARKADVERLEKQLKDQAELELQREKEFKDNLAKEENDRIDGDKRIETDLT